MYRDRYFLALEIEDEFIKAGLIRNSRGNIVVNNITIFQKGKKDIEEVIKSLKKFRRYRKNIVILIPPRKGMIRYLELPSHNYDELRAMIEFQLPRYLPYNFGDIVFDFRIVERKTQGFSKVMVACIRRQFFKEILDTLPYVEKGLYGVFLCGEVGVDLLIYSRRGRVDTSALVDISSEGCVLSIFDSSGVLFMRSLNATSFTGEKDWHMGFEELERSFIAFGREFSERKIESIILTGSLEYASRFYNYLKDHVQYPVELFNPFEAAQCQSVIKKFNDISFHAVIGSGVEKKRMNMVPPEFLSKKKSILKKRARFHTAAMVVVIVFEISFIIYKEMDRKKTYLDCIRTEIRKTEPRAREIEEKEKRVSLIKEQLDTEGSALDILREIYRIIPPNISINILIFEKNNSVSIRGTSTTMAEVFNLIPQLEKSPYFEKVISEGTKMRKVKGRVIADFQIKALFKNRR